LEYGFLAQVEQTDSGVVKGGPATLSSTVSDEAGETLGYDFNVTTNGLMTPVDINIALVLDASGSTGDDSGSDLDGDGVNETVLEAEIMAAKALFQSMLDAGYTGDEVEITLIGYNGSAMTVGTYNMDQQAEFNRVFDQAISPQGSTNYDLALDEVISAWDGINADADPNNNVDAMDSNHVIFLSDGEATEGGTDFSDERAILEGTYNASISAIGVGSASSLPTLDLIDNTDGAVKITDLSQLVGEVSSPPNSISGLQTVEVLIDGVSYGTFTPGDGMLTSTPLGYHVSGGQITGYPYKAGEFMNVDFIARFDTGEQLATQHNVFMPAMVCFAAGTLIDTPEGPRPIETLAPGDSVCLADGGTAPLRWTGRRHISAGMLHASPALRPVRIAAHAFGPGRPARDLVVSPQHRILLDGWQVELLFGEDAGVLAPAATLLNDRTVTRARDLESVIYCHLMFDRHEIVLAEGLPAESLHAGPALWSMPEAARLELFAIFPELREMASRQPTARTVLKRHEARVLSDAFA
jgi:hypothetical protein